MEPLEIGQTLVQRHDKGNPFKHHDIRIVDIKDGWVQYVWAFSDTRESKKRRAKSIEDLLSMFTPITKK